MSNSGIERAIVPAAGLGTRLRPLTRAIPKEMLPLGRKPVLEHVVDELKAAGILKVLFVVSPSKEMIRDYFGDGGEFGVTCDYTIQAEMKGLGDAVLRGAEWAGDEPFVVAFGDCLIRSSSSVPLARVVETHISKKSAATVLCEQLPRENTSRYGILSPVGDLDDHDAPFRMKDIVEKPRPEDAPSTLAVAARWVLNPEVFEFIRTQTPASDGEVNLTDPVRRMIADGAVGWGVPLLAGETRCDIGGWETYLRACVEFANAAMEK